MFLKYVGWSILSTIFLIYIYQANIKKRDFGAWDFSLYWDLFLPTLVIGFLVAVLFYFLRALFSWVPSNIDFIGAIALLVSMLVALGFAFTESDELASRGKETLCFTYSQGGNLQKGRIFGIKIQ